MYAFNYFVEFPGYRGGLFLVEQTETPALPIIGNFIFGDAFLENLVVAVIVQDLNNIDEEIVLSIAEEFMMEGLFGAGFSCH